MNTASPLTNPMMGSVAALTLAREHGLPVFPCRPDKQPYTRHGFKDASSDVGQIAEWWHRHPNALVGVPTGRVSGFIVVDIDPDGAEWYRERAIDLAPGRVHETQRGHHLLYRTPDAELRNSAGRIAPGVDVRAEGGYVIWWPAHGKEVIGDLEDLTDLPSWLLKMIGNAKHDVANPKGEEITEGGRNSGLTSLAGKLRAVGARADELLAGLIAFNSQRCTPPLPESELRKIAQSVERNYPPGNTTQVANVDRPYVLVSLDDILKSAKPPQYIVDGLLEANTTIGIVGPPESGKSLFVADIGVCVATGMDFYGRNTRKGLVVYLWGEGQAGAGRRLHALKSRYHLDQRRAPFAVSKVATSLLDPSETLRVRRAIDAAEEHHSERLALLIVDTLARFIAPGDESKSQDMSGFLGAVDSLRGEATAIICHHPGHSATTRARGSSGWKAALDAEYSLAKKGDVVTVTNQKMKDGEKPAPFSFRIVEADTAITSKDGFSVKSAVLMPTNSVGEALTGKNQKPLLAELQRLAREEGITVWSESALRKIARAIGMVETSAITAVTGLIRHRHLVVSPNGYYLANMSYQGTESTEKYGTPNPHSVHGQTDSTGSLGTVLPHPYQQSTPDDPARINS